MLRGAVCSGSGGGAGAFSSWPKLAPTESTNVTIATVVLSRAVNFERPDPLRDISLRKLAVWNNLFDGVLLRSHASAVKREGPGSNDADYHETDQQLPTHRRQPFLPALPSDSQSIREICGGIRILCARRPRAKIVL